MADKIKSVGGQLRALNVKNQAMLEDISSASLMRLGNRIISESPVDKGRFRNNWMSAYNTPNRSANREPALGGKDSITNLIEKVSDIDLNKDFYFTNSLPYAFRIEYEGWSAQASAGVVRVNVKHWPRIVKEEFNKRK